MVFGLLVAVGCAFLLIQAHESEKPLPPAVDCRQGTYQVGDKCVPRPDLQKPAAAAAAAPAALPTDPQR